MVQIDLIKIWKRWDIYMYIYDNLFISDKKEWLIINSLLEKIIKLLKENIIEMRLFKFIWGKCNTRITNNTKAAKIAIVYGLSRD